MLKFCIIFLVIYVSAESPRPEIKRNTIVQSNNDTGEPLRRATLKVILLDLTKTSCPVIPIFVNPRNQMMLKIGLFMNQRQMKMLHSKMTMKKTPQKMLLRKPVLVQA